MNGLIGILLGGVVAGGGVLVVAGFMGYQLPTSTKTQRTVHIDTRRLTVAVAAGVIVAIVSRWPAAALAVGVGVWAAPSFLGGQKAGAREIERLEGLAVWTESLRDTIAGAMSIEQAIPATVEAAPKILQEPLQRLVDGLRARLTLTEALTRFADDLDHPGSDLVVAALSLNARLRGPGLESVLTELAGHAREELEQRQIVESGRSELHRSGRILVVIVSAVLVGLAAFSPFMDPYSTFVGQFVMAGILALFGFAFWRLRRLAQYKAPPRFLNTDVTRDRVRA